MSSSLECEDAGDARHAGLGLIDLHCHVLPGLDDGARDLGDAIAMARHAQADGIAAVCATPHIRHDHDVRIAELPARRAALAGALAAVGCWTQILAGGEVAAPTLDGLDDSELAAVSLGGGGGWLLVEPAAGPLDNRLAAAVDHARSRGYRTLIAHPERHLGPDLVPRLAELIQRGALVQATAYYLVDPALRPGMLELVRAGVIHVLASDAHSSRFGRLLALSAALAVMAEVEPAATHLDWIAARAPQAIVRGEPLSPPFAPSG